MADNPKFLKTKPRRKVLSDAERIRKEKERNRSHARTKIYLMSEFDRWTRIKRERGLKNNREVVTFLIDNYVHSPNYPDGMLPPDSPKSSQHPSHFERESRPYCPTSAMPNVSFPISPIYDESDEESVDTDKREEDLLLDCESMCGDDDMYETEEPLSESLNPRVRQGHVNKEQGVGLVNFNSIYGLPINLPFCLRYSSQVLDKVLESKVYVVVEQIKVTDMKLRQMKPIRIDVKGGIQEVSLAGSSSKKSDCDRNVNIGNMYRVVEKKTHDKSSKNEDRVGYDVEVNESTDTASETVKTEIDRVCEEMKEDDDLKFDIVSDILNDVVQSDNSGEPSDSGDIGNRTSSKRKNERKLSISTRNKFLKFDDTLDENMPRSARIRSKGYRINYAKLDELNNLSDLSDMNDILSDSDDDSDTKIDSTNNPPSGENDEAGPSGIADKGVIKEDPDFIPELFYQNKSDQKAGASFGVNEAVYQLTDLEQEELTRKRAEIVEQRQLKKLLLQSERIKVNLSDHTDKYYTEDQISVERKDRGKADLEKSFKLLVCGECHKFRTENQRQLEKHLELHINGDLLCKNCEFKGSSLFEIARHKSEFHNPKKKFSCLLCEERFNSKLKKRNHITTVHKILPYLCCLCSTKETPVAFKDNNMLREHFLQNHKGSMFQCSLCGLYYTSKAALRMHYCSESNADDKMPCEICGKKYSPPALHTHRTRVHFNIRPYPCSQCKYAGKSPKQLTEHTQAVHDGIHNYKCDECDFTCVRAFQLTSHKRTHTGDKPYKCDQCPYAAAWNVQLKDHKKLHGGPMEQECDLCGIVVRRGAAYTKHMKKEHGDKDGADD